MGQLRRFVKHKVSEILIFLQSVDLFGTLTRSFTDLFSPKRDMLDNWAALFLTPRRPPHSQHVHTDEESEYSHSRNFTGLINQALFNNGYHTVHHKSPGIHWSKTPAAQKEILGLIDPSLNERSFWWYVTRVYLLAPFRPRLGSVSMRLQRMRLQKIDTVSGAATVSATQTERV